jgi:hypothetical protein
MLTSTVLGLGALDTTTQSQVVAFAKTPQSNFIANIAAFLSLYEAEHRAEIGAALVAAGVASSSVAAALQQLAQATRGWRPSPLYSVLATLSAAASGYHGMKRNNGSVGWGVVWFFLGGFFPVLVPGVALVQGFAKPKKA